MVARYQKLNQKSAMPISGPMHHNEGWDMSHRGFRQNPTERGANGRTQVVVRQVLIYTDRGGRLVMVSMGGLVKPFVTNRISRASIDFPEPESPVKTTN